MLCSRALKRFRLFSFFCCFIKCVSESWSTFFGLEPEALVLKHTTGLDSLLPQLSEHEEPADGKPDKSYNVLKLTLAPWSEILQDSSNRWHNVQNQLHQQTFGAVIRGTWQQQSPLFLCHLFKIKTQSVGEQNLLYTTPSLLFRSLPWLLLLQCNQPLCLDWLLLSFSVLLIGVPDKIYWMELILLWLCLKEEKLLLEMLHCLPFPCTLSQQGTRRLDWVPPYENVHHQERNDPAAQCDFWGLCIMGWWRNHNG